MKWRASGHVDVIERIVRESRFNRRGAAFFLLGLGVLTVSSTWAMVLAWALETFLLVGLDRL